MSQADRTIDVVCFGGEDWWYHNRGHIDMQLMRRYAKTRTVLYVNSIVMQKPRLQRGSKFIRKLKRKAKSIYTGLKRSDAGFWVYSPFSLPLHHLAWASACNTMILQLQIEREIRKLRIYDPVVWVACPAACRVALGIGKSKLVYQRTDRFEEYPNVEVETIKSYDLQLKANADLTIFVNSALFEGESSQCKKGVYLDHGVDFDLFAHAHKDSPIPEDMKAIPKPIAGFFGGIDEHTFDAAFVEKIVDLAADFSFVFVGEVSADVSSLARRKNVWFFGKKSYEEVPDYGKCFDVCLMPWKQNRWIAACNPVKLKEYLALGKPVVSTPFVELQKYEDVVYQAESPQKFADAMKQALRQDGSAQIAARQNKVKQASWDDKARFVFNELFGDC